MAPFAGFSITPLSARFGGRAGAIDLTSDGRDELVCGSGPDPAVDASVRAFRHASSAPSAVPGTPFLPWGNAYGVDVAGSLLGL